MDSSWWCMRNRKKDIDEVCSHINNFANRIYPSLGEYVIRDTDFSCKGYYQLIEDIARQHSNIERIHTNPTPTPMGHYAFAVIYKKTTKPYTDTIIVTVSNVYCNKCK